GGCQGSVWGGPGRPGRDELTPGGGEFLTRAVARGDVAAEDQIDLDLLGDVAGVDPQPEGEAPQRLPARLGEAVEAEALLLGQSGFVGPLVGEQPLDALLRKPDAAGPVQAEGFEPTEHARGGAARYLREFPGRLGGNFDAQVLGEPEPDSRQLANPVGHEGERLQAPAEGGQQAAGLVRGEREGERPDPAEGGGVDHAPPSTAGTSRHPTPRKRTSC